MTEERQEAATPRLPRVTIQFCTQCKWMLRAAYYAQELLSTFSLSLGEVSLQPATGGVFVVDITTTTSTSDATGTPLPPPPITPTTSTTTTAAGDGPSQTTVRLWDRKTDGGFPETKELKRRVRDVIQPGRDLGHVDREYPRRAGASEGDSGGSGKEKGEGAVVEEVEGKAKSGEGKMKAAGEGKEGHKGGEACERGGCEDCQ